MITFMQFLESNEGNNNIRLWRVSDHDDTFEGMSLAEDLETAKIYTNNYGFGGNTIYFADVSLNDMKILELYDFDDLCITLEIDQDDCDNLFRRVQGGNIAGAIPQLDDVRESLKLPH